MEDGIQEKRDEDFSKILETVKKEFHDKNIKYEDSYLTVNEHINDAFDDVERKFNLLKSAVKYSHVSFQKDKFEADLKDLITYSAMLIMFLDKRL